jgi:hypothetical protein
MAFKIWVVIFCFSASNCFSQTNSSIDTAKNAEIFLKNFYTVYITDIAIGSGNSSRSLVKKYCTSKLLNKLAEHSNPEKMNWWDFDPFIKAQDSDTAVLKTLFVSMNKKKANWYSVSYSLKDYPDKKTEWTTIHLVVVKQKAGFKIDDIW